MGQLNMVALTLGLLLLAVGSWMEVSGWSIEEELQHAVDDLRNDSADGYFNIDSDLSNVTVLDYYNLVLGSEGNDSLGLSLRYVPAMGYAKPYPLGNGDFHGPAWGVHFIPGFFFWPPIPKRVCSRPCLTYGYRCRPSCCETRCIYRYVWRCYYNNYPYYNYYCQSYGFKEVCYEQHNACKCTCAYNYPYCYF